MDEINKALYNLRFTPQTEIHAPKTEQEKENDSGRLNSLLDDLSSLSFAPKISHSYVSSIPSQPQNEEIWTKSRPKFIPPTRSMWIPPDLITQLQQGCLHSRLIVVDPFVIGIWFNPNPNLFTSQANIGVSSDVQRWHLNEDEDVVGKFVCSDGQCSRATFNTHLGKVELEVLEAENRSTENKYPIPFPELDIPDIVCEFASLFLGGPFLPELVGENAMQLFYLIDRVKKYLASNHVPAQVNASHATTIAEENMLLRLERPTTVSHSNRGAFLMTLSELHKTFFQEWSTDSFIARLAPCCTRSQRADEQQTSFSICTCLKKPCIELSRAIRDEEHKIIQDICSRTLHWVMQSLSTADDVWISTGFNLRKERMRHWTNLINADPSILTNIFSYLGVTIDLYAAIEMEGWLRVLTVVMARLADDILLYQIAQGTDLKLFSLWMVENFREIVTGKGIYPGFEVTEYLPLRG